MVEWEATPACPLRPLVWVRHVCGWIQQPDSSRFRPSCPKCIGSEISHRGLTAKGRRREIGGSSVGMADRMPLPMR